MSADLETRAAQIRAAVADGHHTVTAIAQAISLSPRRVRDVLPQVPGLITETVRLPGHGPRAVLFATLPEVDDDPPPRPFVNPIRARALGLPVVADQQRAARRFATGGAV